MRGADWLVLLSLLDDGSESPPGNSNNFGARSPLRGVWRLFKFFIVLFLLLWFLFHQNFFSIELKSKWKEKGTKVEEHEQTSRAQLTHIVKNGESLSDIAARTGVSKKLLVSMNRLEDPNRIYPGQRLVLPVQTDKHSSKQ